MSPTFRNLDILFVRTVKINMIGRGDIIVFKSPGSDIRIVHRVIHNNGEFLITRGDNLAKDDKYSVKQDDIAGLVFKYNRNGKEYSVSGGIIGYLTFRYYRFRNSIVLFLAGCKIYLIRLLLSAGFIRRIIIKGIRYKIVAVRIDDVKSYRALYGKTIIADFNNSNGVWQLRAPYDLLFSADEFPGKDELEA